MTLEIVETFMTIGSTTAKHPVVFRYSLHYGSSRVDVAHLKTDVFDDPARATNWEWIPEKSKCQDLDNQTHWSMLVGSICDFDNIGMFAPKAVKAKGQIFATFKDFQNSIANMLNKTAYLKELFESDDVNTEMPTEKEELPMIELPAKISDTLSIDNIAFGDEHIPVIDESGETTYYRYVYLDIIDSKVGVIPSLMISTDLFFEDIIFDHTQSPWDFLKNPDSSTNVPDTNLVERLEASIFEIRNILKIVFDCELDS